MTSHTSVWMRSFLARPHLILDLILKSALSLLQRRKLGPKTKILRRPHCSKNTRRVSFCPYTHNLKNFHIPPVTEAVCISYGRPNWIGWHDSKLTNEIVCCGCRLYVFTFAFRLLLTNIPNTHVTWKTNNKQNFLFCCI